MNQMANTPSTIGSPSTTIVHRTNKASSLIHNRRPQSMLSARALMFDEPSTSSSFDRDLCKLSTSPKQQQQQQIHQTSQPLTPPSFRKDFLINSSGGGASSGSGLFKSASAVTVGRDFSGSVTPIQHQRKISYQNSHLFRSSGSGSSSRTELSNLIRIRNSQLGKSAPSLSPNTVSDISHSTGGENDIKIDISFCYSAKMQSRHIPPRQQLQCFYRLQNDRLAVLAVVDQHYHLEVQPLPSIGFRLGDIITLQLHPDHIHQFQPVQLIAQELILRQVCHQHKTNLLFIFPKQIEWERY